MRYFKGNFLPGREVVDEAHLHELLAEWLATIANLRIRGTTHERPIDRFAQEQTALLPTGGQPSFRLETPLRRIVADDWLANVDTNRYSVPFTLIGQPVEVHRRTGMLRIVHRGALVVEHAELVGKHQVRILPKHSPGAITRTTHQRHSTPSSARSTGPAAVVEVRDMAIYDALLPRGEIAALLTGLAVGPNAGLALPTVEVPVCSNASRSTCSVCACSWVTFLFEQLHT